MSPAPPDNDLSDRACQLLGLLASWRERHGPGERVTDQLAARRLDADVRSIVNLAGELLEHGHLVLASCDKHRPGRYLLLPGDDLRPAYAHCHGLRTRARKILVRRRNLIRALRRAELVGDLATDGQLRLPLRRDTGTQERRDEATMSPCPPVPPSLPSPATAAPRASETSWPFW